MNRSLSKSFTSSWPSNPAVGPASSRFFGPSTTSLGLAPFEAGCHAHLSSALRFSQPLSGFLADPSFAALFRAATVLGFALLQSFPLAQSRAPLSRPAGSPAVIRRRAETHPRPPYHRRFLQTLTS